MTPRAILFGVIGALLIAAIGYINDVVLGLESILAGQLVPAVVFGTLVIVLIVVVPLLRRVHRRLAPRPAEIVTVVLLMLAACSVASRGMMFHFSSAVALPAHWYRQMPGWRKQKLLDHAPRALLVAEGSPAIEQFIEGKGTPGEALPLAEVPWKQWEGPLTGWLPAILLTAVGMVCMAMIVHRQWSRRERLRYPIAEFMTTVVWRDPAHPVARIFRSRVFWWALGAILAVRLLNGLSVAYGDGGAIVPFNLNFMPMLKLWPGLRSAGWWMYGLLIPRIYPIVIAFAFFLASDISLSVGVSHVLVIPLTVLLVTRGFDVSTSYMAGGGMGWSRAGAYVAFTLILLYNGRAYYRGLLTAALTFRRRGVVQPYEAWACRVFLVAGGVLAAMFTAFGLAWPLAIATVAIMMLTFLCVSRLSAETGLFFIHPRFTAAGLLLGLMGGYAMGPQGFIVCAVLCTILCLDPAVALMPYLVNVLRVCDRVGVPAARASWSAAGTYVAALVVAVVVAIWAGYNYGHPRTSARFLYWRVPTMALRHGSTEVGKLQDEGALAASVALRPLQRLGRIKPQPMFLWTAGLGFAAVILFHTLRMRYARWPLHPALFLVWATYPIYLMWFSFLLGWAIKSGLTRLGGHATAQKARPLMIGVIAGELVSAMLFIAIGGIHFLATGTKLRAYQFLPY